MGGSNNGGWSKRRETWGSDSIIDFKRNDDSLTNHSSGWLTATAELNR